MNPGSRPAPVTALDHPAMETMMLKIASETFRRRSTLAPPIFTSVVTGTRNTDERLRKWFIFGAVAKLHLGISQLSDPLDEVRPPSNRSVVTPEQRAAGRQVQEWYMEGLVDILMRLYDLGVTRISTAAFLYALDFSLWMRGYAIPSGEFATVPFNFAQPPAHVGPFCAEYDDFFATVYYESHPTRRAAVPDISLRTALEIAQQVTNTSANIEPAVREEAERVSPKTPATDGAPASTAQKRHDYQNPNPNVTIPSVGLVDMSDGLDEEASLPPATLATEARRAKKRPLDEADSEALTQPVKRLQISRICGNEKCRSRHHELADCFGPPSAHGDIERCPLCNTQEHNLDSCKGLNHITREALFEILVTRRANLPPIRSVISIPALAASLRKLDGLTLTMPLLRSTVIDEYVPLKPWEYGGVTKLFRDPYFPTDLVPFLEVLTERWHLITIQTMPPYLFSEQVPQDMTVFNQNWLHKLVPYREAFEAANIHVKGRGAYPFGPGESLLQRRDGLRQIEEDWKDLARRHLSDTNMELD